MDRGLCKMKGCKHYQDYPDRAWNSRCNKHDKSLRWGYGSGIPPKYRACAACRKERAAEKEIDNG